MRRRTKIISLASVMLAGWAVGCTPVPSQTAQSPSAPVKQASNSCQYYTGSRLCYEPGEQPSINLSCDAMTRAIRQGDAQQPGALACDRAGEGAIISPNAQVPVVVHR